LALNLFHDFRFQMSRIVFASTPNRTASALLSWDFAPLRMLSAKLGASASISRAVSAAHLRSILPGYRMTPQARSRPSTSGPATARPTGAQNSPASSRRMRPSTWCLILS
jgi:hypothetical protein